MSGQILLDSVIKKLKANYPAGLSEDKLFEFYVADNLLVNFDLDHQEIDSGIVDGSRDAGVDAAYVFINRQLLTDDLKLDVVKQPVEIELVVIQSKNQDNFKEAPLDRLAGSLPLLLDPGQPQAVLESKAYRAAAKILDRDHDRMVAEIITLTEIPAPPFKEAARAAAYRDIMGRQPG